MANNGAYQGYGTAPPPAAQYRSASPQPGYGGQSCAASRQPGYGGPQASPAPIGPPQFGQWTTDLYACSQDLDTCLMASLFPCILHGQMANILDQGQTPCWLGAFLILASQYRTKLRQKFSLPAVPFDDVFSRTWCFWCSVAQEYRELKLRGIHPALGYDAVKVIYELPQLHPPRFQEMEPYDILSHPEKYDEATLSTSIVFNCPSPSKKPNKGWKNGLPPKGLSATTVFDSSCHETHIPPLNDLPPRDGLSATTMFDAPLHHKSSLPNNPPAPRSSKSLSAYNGF